VPAASLIFLRLDVAAKASISSVIPPRIVGVAGLLAQPRAFWTAALNWQLTKRTGSCHSVSVAHGNDAERAGGHSQLWSGPTLATKRTAADINVGIFIKPASYACALRR
jgi:hypothetical protein